MQVASKVMVPSPDEVLLVVQLAESIPEPPVLSVQFHVTVTSALFQPAPLAAGDCVGKAVGGVLSVRVKLAVIVPVPFIVAVVDADDVFENIILDVDALHEEKA